MIKNKKAFSIIELSVVILVIGILVIGITQGSRILAESKLKSARTLTDSSPVNSMLGLVLWLDATDSSTIAAGTAGSGVYNMAENNSDVTDWKDRNPQNSFPKVVSAPANTNRPKYIKNGIGGLPTIDFDGSSDYLINSDTQGPIASGKTGYTVAVVWRSDVRTTMTILGQTGASSSCNGTYAGMVTNNTALRSWGCGGSYDFGTLAFAANTPYVAIVRVNQLNNLISAYLNSSSQTGSPTLMATLESGGISVAGRLDGSGSFFNGYISEIIVFDRALRNDEITSIQEYLSKKYSIKVI
jgi:prepilin-type N-terminal cleavage/methylation domain-containing protein